MSLQEVREEIGSGGALVPSAALVNVLSSMSLAMAGALELRDVFSRVAESVRPLVPFDLMGILRCDGTDRVILYSVAGGRTLGYSGTEIPRCNFSPALWPTMERPSIIEDTEKVLDSSFCRDREVLESGMRALLRAPLRLGSHVFGYLWFASRTPGAFSRQHELLIEPVANLVTLALEHERLASIEKERRRRFDALDALLPTLSLSLDVREVFEQLSVVSASVVKHDLMTLGLLSEDRKSVRIHAYTGEKRNDVPESFELEPDDYDNIDSEFLIMKDVEEELRHDSVKYRLFGLANVRSWLRVPLRREGQVVGGLSFLSRVPGTYVVEDVDLARRIADHVQLILSHQDLAEAARQKEKAQEEAARLERRVAALTQELETTSGHRRVIGHSRAWKSVLSQASKVAPTDTTVLLTGESGTGKEVVSRFLHRGSLRVNGPFIALNCAALPDQLLESELFGYEKGAFTGATAQKPGRIEQAAQGTLFLDEVGEMSPLVQAKLLRVLQEREVQRLGGTKVLKAEVRVIAATNRDLQSLIAKGLFREDLYYRLHVFEINLPPLRERPEDILPLAEAFLGEIGQDVGRPSAGISKEAREQILAYPWPGNVRELRNALERAVILCEGGLITAEHLPISIARHEAATARAVAGVAPAPSGAVPAGAPQTAPPPNGNGSAMSSAPLDISTLEKSMVEEALVRAKNNKSKAAKLLGLTRAQLYSRLQKYGLS
ncbi:MAG: sigma 54-interacting transcriptional regulator [Acidobacteria bacterium]|nr:sigma 54-interacting transcriptional regulator [Acidobacteriota bacterium]